LGVTGKASDAKGQPLNPAMLSEILSSRILWMAALGLVVAVGTSLGSFSMLPLFLVVEHGFDQTSVNVLLALSRVACLFTAFSAGMLCDRMGAFKALIIFLSLTGMLTILLGQSSGHWVWVLLFVQPAVAVCMFAPIFTFLSLSMPPQTRSLGVSMVTTCATLFGAGLMPIGLGYMGEMGRFGTGFSIMGILILVGVVVLYYLGRGSKIAAK
jgi:fucose permease